MKRTFDLTNCEDAYDVLKEVLGAYGLEPKESLDFDYGFEEVYMESKLWWQIGSYDYDPKTKKEFYVLNPAFTGLDIFHAQEEDGVVLLQNVTDITGGVGFQCSTPYSWTVYNDWEELDSIDPYSIPSVSFSHKGLTNWKSHMKDENTPITIIKLSYDSELVIIG